ncbi:hypothetical protein LRP88_09438 [Fusarium phalaenopsidis]
MKGQPIHQPRPMRVICIGAGISGIAAAYKAQRDLINTEFIIYEKDEDVGGTWLENRYPGCACDIPSHSYTFSWEGNPDWTRFKWQWPDIPGLDDFKGPRLHPARWDTSLDLTGKRVAVIGAGSSALQIVPTIQPIVSKLINFIRSPTWVTLEYGHAFASEGRETKFSEAQRQTFRSDRKALLEYRKVLLDGSTKAFDLYYKGSEMQKKAFEANRELMRQRLKGHEEICERLIPNFEVGCRRVSPGHGYLEALIEPNSTAVFDGIKCINQSGILDNNGVQHDVDVIVCATGFDVSHRPAFPVLGRDGVDLRDYWAEGPIHYLSVASPGFPNYFIAGGPNSPISNVSLVMGLELAVDYAFSVVRKMQTEDIGSVEVQLEAANDFLEQRDLIMQDLVWTGSCSSW